jgi:hypothetical protein
MWELESAAPPADPEARQIQITLAQSRPRYVSPDLEFAVWTATIGESREGEPVTVTGPLGHVTAGEQLVCTGAFSQHPRYGWQFSVETFRSALPQSPEGIALWLMTRVPGIGPTFAGAIVDHFGSEQVFAELDRRPERLREVRTKAGRAISRRSVERAIAAWREVATIRGGRDVPLHARDQRQPRGPARAPVRRRGRRRADARSVPARRAPPGGLQDRGRNRSLARRRAR